MSETKKIKVAFAGVGKIGQVAHLKNYATLPDCEVVSLCEIREDLRIKVAARYGVPRVYNNIEEMVDAGGFDAVVASQPFFRHAQLIPPLLKAKVPLFTEKPLASSIESGEKILKALEESGTWHMVGYNRRSDPAVMYAKAEIERLKETQELGPLTYIRILMPGGDWIAGGFSDLIRSEQKVKDLDLERDPPASDLNWCAFRWYQMMIDYYIHPINLMRHMLGEPYALTYVSPSRGIMAGSSDSGVACLIEMTPFHTTIDWQETVLVCFKRGWIKIEIPASLAVNKPGRITLYRDPGGGIIPQTIEPQLPWIGSMRQQAINFIRAVKGEIEPLCNAAEAFEDLKIAREYIRMRMEQMDLEE